MDCQHITRLLAFLLLTAGTLQAQEYSFRTFGNSEGLNNLAIRQIYQDHVGFIWVSTENGIYRFDGDTFEAFGPPDLRRGFPLLPVPHLAKLRMALC